MKTYTQEEVDKIIADTIEACAKVCDDEIAEWIAYELTDHCDAIADCAAAIRSRCSQGSRGK